MLSFLLICCFYRSGPVNCKAFMSDDASQYWDAWKAAYGSGATLKLLCMWHVLQNWKDAIKAKVDSENIVCVRIWLKKLILIPAESQFQLATTKFLTYVDEAAPEFATYFRNHYLCRPKEWARWARRGKSIVNVNMFVEAFNRTFKEKFLCRKQNNRLDKVVHQLLLMASWYLKKYVVSCERGGPPNNYRQKELHDRHKRSVGLSTSDVVSVSDKRWIVKSASKEGVTYEVTEVEDNFPCRLR